MGSPYNKMISAKFYVETWVRRLDTFFRHKRYFRAFFRHKRYFFDTYRYRYRSKAGGASSPRYKAADHTGGGTLYELREGEEPPNSPKYHKKRYFPAFFDTKDLFFDTYRYRYRSRSGGASSPRHMAADHTAGGPSAGPGKQSSLQTVQNTLKNALFYQKKSHYYLTTETLPGTGTTPNGWGLPSPAIGRRVTPGGRLERPQGTSPGLFSAKKEPQKEPQKAVSPQKARQKSGKEIFFGQPFWFPRSACVGAFNRAKQLA